MSSVIMYMCSAATRGMLNPIILTTSPPLHAGTIDHVLTLDISFVCIYTGHCTMADLDVKNLNVIQDGCPRRPAAAQDVPDETLFRSSNITSFQPGSIK